MRSLFLPFLLVVATGCSQNPHVNVSSQPRKTTAAAIRTTPVPDASGQGDVIPPAPTPDSKDNPNPVPTPDQSLADRDGDGVPDIYDKCPDVPGPIYNDGCPLDEPLADRDGDGVPDIYDKCPDVPGEIYNDGCPLEGLHQPLPPAVAYPYPHARDEERRALLDVKESLKFDFDRFVIKAESFSALHRLAEFMKSYPVSHLYMVGHADDRGTYEYNQWLSAARVFAVKDFLVSKGISADRISVDAKGKTQPLVSVEGKEGRELDEARAQNRRVDMSIRYVEVVR